MALEVLRVLREANLRVPNDIALIGFDDLPLAQQTDPPVTTMCQPVGRRNSEASMVPAWPRTASRQ